jgi:hypothetical protein
VPYKNRMMRALAPEVRFLSFLARSRLEAALKSRTSSKAVRG